MRHILNLLLLQFNQCNVLDNIFFFCIYLFTKHEYDILLELLIQAKVY